MTGKGKIHSKQSDLSKPEEIKKAFDWVEQEFGGADIVINNAAVLFDGSITCMYLLYIHILCYTPTNY